MCREQFTRNVSTSVPGVCNCNVVTAAAAKELMRLDADSATQVRSGPVQHQARPAIARQTTSI